MNGTTYTYPAAPYNNGKIQTEVAGGETVTYQYDSLNRLISAVSTGPWGQGFTYDGFGNLTGKSVLKGSAPYLSAGVDPATNRIVGYTYDSNGNQWTTDNQTLMYDVDNRMVSASNRDSTGFSYGYDSDNRRVYASNWTYDSNSELRSITNGKVYFWGASGQLMGTYELVASAGSPPYSSATMKFYWVAERTYFAGRMLGTDRLGSYGSYFPYGEVRSGSGGMFATYTRDAGGLDYAVNRYYSSGLGRFMTPDPYRATTGSVNNPADPGSWNRYSYVVGDPVGNYDPDGLQAQGPTPYFYRECWESSTSSTGYSCAWRTAMTFVGPENPEAARERPTAHEAAEALAENIGKNGITDCLSLASFADYAARNFADTKDDFVRSFGVFVPSSHPAVRLANLLGAGVASDANAVVMNPAGSSGFRPAYQDSENSMYDQVHHFSAYFEFGYLAGALESDIAAWLTDRTNAGDYDLAVQAAGLGRALKMGSLSVKDIAEKIRSTICK